MGPYIRFDNPETLLIFPMKIKKETDISCLSSIYEDFIVGVFFSFF